MGAINCTKTMKNEEETSLAANAHNSFSIYSYANTKTIYQTLFERVSLAKNKFIASVNNDPLSKCNNYDYYYGIIVNHILPKTTIGTISTCINCEEEKIKVYKAKTTKKAKTTSITPFINKTNSRIRKNKSSSKKKVKTNNTMVGCSGVSKEKSKMKLSDVNKGQISKFVENSVQTKFIGFTVIDNEEYNVKLDIISLLPKNIIKLIFSFIIDQYWSCIMVDVAWYATLLSNLECEFDSVINKLQEVYEGKFEL